MTSLECQSIENMRPYTAFYKSMYQEDIGRRKYEGMENERMGAGHNEVSKSFKTLKPKRTTSKMH